MWAKINSLGQFENVQFANDNDSLYILHTFFEIKSWGEFNIWDKYQFYRLECNNLPCVVICVCKNAKISNIIGMALWLLSDMCFVNSWSSKIHISSILRGLFVSLSNFFYTDISYSKNLLQMQNSTAINSFAIWLNPCKLVYDAIWPINLNLTQLKCNI